MPFGGQRTFHNPTLADGSCETAAMAALVSWIEIQFPKDVTLPKAKLAFWDLDKI